WDVTLLSIKCESTNPSAMNTSLRIERLGRGEFAISGTFFNNIELDKDVIVELRIYRSHSGNEEDYKLTPYSIAPQPFDVYLNTMYRSVLMKTIGDCHDMPKYENGYDYPFPKGTFNITRCQLTGGGLPEILTPGFYRGEAIIDAHPTVVQTLTLIVRISLKMF
ncbi:hypothetical protein KR009_000763, partial [Drosophila setifemur]